MKINLLKLLIIIALVMNTSLAFAYEKGDWLVRGRILHIRPNVDSGHLYAIDKTVNLGKGIDVKSDTIPELDISYMLTRHWALETILGYSKHDVATTGNPKEMGLGTAIKTKVLPATLTLQYHFSPTSNSRPYMGVGLNYTYFFDEKVSGVLDQSGAKVNLKSSLSLAMQAGIDIYFNDDWFINVDVKYIQIDTKAKLKSINLVGNAEIKAELNPLVFGLGIGRRF